MNTDSPPRYSKLAELKVESFANEIGAVCNRVGDDQTGWDYVIEENIVPDLENTPADLRPPLRRAFVQVKHSTSSEKHTHLKLSNALRYSKDDAAWFIIFLRYDQSGSPDPRYIYVKHFWASMMASALRRSRMAHVQKRELQSIKFKVTMDDADLCTGNPVQKMFEELSHTGPKYSEQKLKLAESLGYDEATPAAIGSFTVEADVKSFVDLNLGLIESLPLTRFSVADNRFGILGPERTFGPGRLSIEPAPIRKCLVTVRNSVGSEVSWPGEMFVPGIPNLPKEHRRMRIAAGPVQVILSPDRVGKINANFSFEGVQSLDELSRQLAFRSWCSEKRIQLEIWSDGKCLVLSDVSFDRDATGAAYFWSRLHRAYSKLIGIVPSERLPQSLQISIQELSESIESMEEFVGYLSDSPGKVTSTLDCKPNEEILDTRALIMPLYYEIADHVFLVVIEREVTKASIIETSIELRTKNSRILRSAVLLGKGEDHRELVAQQVKWAGEQADNRGGHVLSYRPNIDELSDE